MDMKRQSARPLLTVMIPTRERCDTLQFTLQTVVTQNFADSQILVSDNASEDDTPAVVRGFEDPRITYVRTARRMSMSDHWDFALEHATGEYVIAIGDDDGIMPGALERLASLISTQPAPIYCWNPNGYVWPIGKSSPKLVLSAIVPNTTVNLRSGVEKTLRWGTWGWAKHLVPIYHSAISRKIPDAMRVRTGRVFHSTCPDVFTSYAVPAFAESAVRVGEAVSTFGVSAKSNSGTGYGGGHAATDRFLKEFGEYRIHSKLYPGLPLIANLDADSALIAADLFPQYYQEIQLNYDAMWALRQRVHKFDSIAGVLKKRREIRAYHPFSVPRFLFYRCVVHAFDQVRNVVRRGLAKRDLQSRLKAAGITDLPQNVMEAVSVIAKLCQLSSV
jgi:glycosyltransferase involved in cell wall biosynthesis